MSSACPCPTCTPLREARERIAELEAALAQAKADVLADLRRPVDDQPINEDEHPDDYTARRWAEWVDGWAYLRQHGEEEYAVWLSVLTKVVSDRDAAIERRARAALKGDKR